MIARLLDVLHAVPIGNSTNCPHCGCPQHHHHNDRTHPIRWCHQCGSSLCPPN